MCNCLEKNERAVKDLIVKEAKKKGIKIHSFVNEGESGFQCKGLMFSSGKWEFVLPMEFNYIRLKSDGSPEKRMTKRKTNLFPSYCPMCGEKIKLWTN